MTTKTDFCLEKLTNIVDNIIYCSKRKNTTGSGHIRDVKLNKMISEAGKSFQELKTFVINNSNYWYQLGRMYQCSSKYLLEGIEALRTAVQLDPNSVEMWNTLGEIYWDVGKIELSKECFEKALVRSFNKVSLRNISIVTRKQAIQQNRTDRKNLTEKALVLAKQALNLDLTDGESWSILGNSYLAVFFDDPRNKKIISQSISCYTQAEKNLKSIQKSENNCLLDVYYNKAIALQYIENYNDSLDYFLKCSEIDKTWDLPLKKYKHLVRYLDSIKYRTGNKGAMNLKKYNVMVKDLCDKELSKELTSSNIIFESSPIKTHMRHYKLIWILDVDIFFPSTFGVLGTDEVESVVTVFNLNASCKVFEIGATIIIPNPQYEVIDIYHLEKEYKFKKIRVDDPSTLFLNDKLLPNFCFANYNFETLTV